MENVKVTETKDTLTLVIDLKATIAEAGSPNAKGEPRKGDLVASSHGFTNYANGIGVSLNVTRRAKAK